VARVSRGAQLGRARWGTWQGWLARLVEPLGLDDGSLVIL
jgi:hypothetical protein